MALRWLAASAAAMGAASLAGGVNDGAWDGASPPSTLETHTVALRCAGGIDREYGDGEHAGGGGRREENPHRRRSWYTTARGAPPSTRSVVAAAAAAGAPADQKSGLRRSLDVHATDAAYPSSRLWVRGGLGPLSPGPLRTAAPPPATVARATGVRAPRGCARPAGPRCGWPPRAAAGSRCPARGRGTVGRAGKWAFPPPPPGVCAVVAARPWPQTANVESVRQTPGRSEPKKKKKSNHPPTPPTVARRGPAQSRPLYTTMRTHTRAAALAHRPRPPRLLHVPPPPSPIPVHPTRPSPHHPGGRTTHHPLPLPPLPPLKAARARGGGEARGVARQQSRRGRFPPPPPLDGRLRDGASADCGWPLRRNGRRRSRALQPKSRDRPTPQNKVSQTRAHMGHPSVSLNPPSPSQ